MSIEIDAPRVNDSRFVNNVCTNTKSDLIEITEDKLENILLKFLEDFRTSRDWYTYLSLFIAILITFLTADFHDFLGINKNIWCAIFSISLLLTLLFSIVCIAKAIIKRKKIQIGYLISTIKNN